MTDGANEMPWAEIEYPIGDKSSHSKHPTEIEILPGDLVWVAFIGDDVRYPIITGYRNKTEDNSQDWRRWHHENIALEAEKRITMEARFIQSMAELKNSMSAEREITLQAPVIRLIGAVILEGGQMSAGAGQALVIRSGTSVTIGAPIILEDTPTHITKGEHTDSNGKHS